ncbi:MAG: hypothetical protein M1501_04180 [Candidatus Omnitrophica bacterium]|nr:hypothetical protein [Candidatus Omnitrophota bacterium]
MKRILAIGILLCLFSIGYVFGSNISSQKKPSILFCAPQAGYGWVDLGYLRQLTQKGFEVDYTTDLSQVTWNRIKHYNVLVIYVTPDAFAISDQGQRSFPEEKEKSFVNLIKKYLSHGGGVFLFPSETNITWGQHTKQQVSDLTNFLGAKVPVDLIVEKNPADVSAISHMSYGVSVAWTDNVFPTSVSQGVKGIWYPTQPAYFAQMTSPLWVNKDWQVVIRASKTAYLQPVNFNNATDVIKHPFILPAETPEPVLFAIRSYKTGRIAFMDQWRQFSIGAGTKWLYNNEVLSKGFKGRPSDFGRLLDNTFKWLAEPSLKNHTLGGYTTLMDKLIPPNYLSGVKKQYNGFNSHFVKNWVSRPNFLNYGRSSVPPHLYRGLIGVKTTFSTGKNTVRQYAQEAQKLGLNFLVFMDNFSQLTPVKFKQLKEECKKYSNDKLKLFAGFSIKNNIGNHMLFFGPHPAWPPDNVLTGHHKDIIYIQQENKKGQYTYPGVTPFIDWVLNNYSQYNQVAYYDFSGSKEGMKMHDLRLYGMAGLMYYKNGRLVENDTKDYLTTVQGAMPSVPASIDEVDSVRQLSNAVKENHYLTYVNADSLDNMFMSGLRWNNQYDGFDDFISNGPKILAWPACWRVITYGGEQFITAPNVMPSHILVTSKIGLKEIDIYNGQHLFRRIFLHGEKEFNKDLILNATIQKNLVLIAKDIAGHKAISFPRISRFEGDLAPVFCSDHENSYAGALLFSHGPAWFPLVRIPPLPNAGDTWDGGPLAVSPLTGNQSTVPVLDSSMGKEDGGRFNQIPLLNFSDEGAVGMEGVHKDVFDNRLLAVANTWNTCGPIAGPSKLFKYSQYYREWFRPTVDVPHTGWAGPQVGAGTTVSLFREVITFRKNLKVKSLLLGYNTGNQTNHGFLVIGTNKGMEQVDLSKPGNYKTFHLKKGDWFGYYNKQKQPANSALFINRGGPIYLQNNAPYVFIYADINNKQVKKGDIFIYELSTLGFPVNVEIHKVSQLLRYINELKTPGGLLVARGTKVQSSGIEEFIPENHAVELYIQKPFTSLPLTLPVRIQGLNPRWSAGLFLIKGYGDFGTGENLYRPLAVSRTGHAYIPMYVDWSTATWLVAGQPIVAGKHGKKLFIQVTRLQAHPGKWYVAVNNPTNKTITTILHPTMDLPGLVFHTQFITLKPGEYRVLQH